MVHIRSICVFVLLAALLFAVDGPTTPARAQVPAPSVVAQAIFPITAFAGDATLMNVIVDFGPNASTPDHTHGGPVTALVLNGDITLQDAAGAVTKHPAGTFWTELPGHVHHAVNEGSTPARISVVGLIPKSGKLTMPETNSAYTPHIAPTLGMQAQFPLGVAAGEAVLTNVIVEFAPGAATPEHVHGGPVLATVLAGALTVHNPTETRVYRAGESWTEFPNNVHRAANEGTEVARLSVAAILPKGAPLTSPVGQPGMPAALPHTGSNDRDMLRWLLLASAAAIGSGLWIRRSVRQRRT